MNPGGSASEGRGRAARVLRRLARHEARALTSIGLWLARRRDGVGPGDTAAPYASAQASTMLIFGALSVVETVALAVIVPWPLVHLVLLVIDIYGVVFVLGMHASSVVRPHVVLADGSLRVRYAALLDLRIPASEIASAAVDRRYPVGGITTEGETLTVPVAGLTTVTVRLHAPHPYLRPLGSPAQARVLHLYTDAPAPLVEALTRAPA